MDICLGGTPRSTRRSLRVGDGGQPFSSLPQFSSLELDPPPPRSLSDALLLQNDYPPVYFGLGSACPRRLEAWVARTPGDRHARRLLGRIAAHGADRAGLEGLVD